MKRYDLVTNYRCGDSIQEMEPSDDGEWVHYEEAEAIIDGLLREIEVRAALHGSEAGPQPHTWHGLMAGFAPRTEKPFLTNTTNSGNVGGPTNP